MSARRPAVAVIGTGLIGTSLALALKESGFCASISGFSRRKETLEQAVAAGAVDTKLETLKDAVASDIIVLAAPVGAIIEHLHELGSTGCESRLVIDVGSIKTAIMEAAAESGLGRRFVGGHPMAGSVERGPDNANSELFKNRTFFLIPTVETSEEALEIAKELVRTVGATVVIIDAEEHDRTVALTSHLPYLLSAALTKLAGEQTETLAYIRAAVAGAFRGATRLTEGSPEMWADIITGNAANIREWLQEFIMEADSIIAAAGDPGKLKDMLHTFREFHRRLME